MPEVLGKVTYRDGAAARNVQILVTAKSDSIFVALGDARQRTVVARGGTFSLRLCPGEYSIVAKATETLGARASDNPTILLAWTKLSVGTAGFLGLPPLRLQRAPAVAGKVEIHRSRLGPSLQGPMLVRLSSDEASGLGLDLPPARVGADGAFAFRGVPPGDYYIEAFPLGSQNSSPIAVEAIVVGGKSVVGEPIRVEAGQDVTDIIVTFRDGGELTGTVIDDVGRGNSEYFVVLFASDSRFWFPRSGRNRGPVRPATDGSFRFSGLLPGEYRLAVIRSIPIEEWQAADFLRTLVESSLAVSIRAGTQTRDVRLSSK